MLLENLNERTRTLAVQPDSLDEETRSVRAVIATEVPAISTDDKTGKGVLDVWCMDGAILEDCPLVDSHNVTTVRAILGSMSHPTTGSGEMTARLQISEAEPAVWTKVREGHIRSVSGRCLPLAGQTVKRGTSANIEGRTYAAPLERDLNVVTRWRLREVSLVAIGADSRAKIRSSNGECRMDERVRKFLESIGLRSDATAEQAKEFYGQLPEATRALADVGAEVVPAVVPAKVVPPEVTRTEPTPESIRSEAAVAERKRIAEITRLSQGLPAELVRQAVDEGWESERYKSAFLEAMQGQRAGSVGGNGGQFNIRVRNENRDHSVSALGLGLAMRSLSGDDLYRSQSSYQPVEEGSNEYILRRSYGDAKKKEQEHLLELADRYRNLSMHDVAREACRLEGKPVSLTTSIGETLRTAGSGSALSKIFTTSINAQFLSGYTDFTDTTAGWTSEADVNNFLTQERDTMGKFGSLTKVTKNRPADHMDTSDSKESYKIARYGGQFVIDDQDFVNDRFGALQQESPKDMGLSAAQLRPSIVYSLMLANAALDVDAVALFDTSTHKNYVSSTGTALAAASLQTAIASMAKQRIGGRVLNIRPRFLICPQDLWATAKILLTSAERIISTSDGGTRNPLTDIGITLVFDDRVGLAGVTDPTTNPPTARAGTAANWFLAARPGEEGAKTIEVGYLRGSGRAPSIRSFVLDRGQWGMGWDVKMDIGAKALDFRGLYKSLGDA